MGRYVRDNLRSDESVVYETRLHWIMYAAGFSLTIVGLCLLFFTSALSIPGAFLFVAGVISLIVAWIRRVTSEFAVTNKRVIIKIGVIWRRTIEMNLSSLETIEVDQDVIGRIIGYGKVVIIGTGGTNEPFSRIENPLEFRKAVQSQLK